MTWIRVLEENELLTGQTLVVSAGERKVMVVNFNGDIYAMHNLCPHLNLPLELGRAFEQDGICAYQCPWHRSSFDMTTGDVTAWSPWPPGIGRVLGTLSRQKTLQIYRTKEEDGGIWVEMPEDDDV